MIHPFGSVWQFQSAGHYMRDFFYLNPCQFINDPALTLLHQFKQLWSHYFVCILPELGKKVDNHSGWLSGFAINKSDSLRAGA